MAFFGICYSPYRRSDRHPPYKLPETEVLADMKAIAERKFTHVRTYTEGGDNDGNIWNVSAASQCGLKVALGVWVDADHPELTKARIVTALTQAQAHPGTVIRFVIGNEVDRTDVATYKPEAILAAMNYAKSERQRYPNATAIKVTTCFSGTVLQHANSPWLRVIEACEEDVYLTVYPWYGGAVPGNISPQMKWSWENGLSQIASLGKTVVIAEIGWPSAGRADATVANQQLNYGVTKSWVSGQNFLSRAFDAFWFEMFDEPWKTAEGAQGPHWGLYTADGKPKFDF